MPAMAGLAPSARSAAYADGWAHLADELRWFDLLLRRRVLRQPRAGVDDPLSAFKGLVITDAEISDLLAHPEHATSEADVAEQQALIECQNEIQARLPP